MLKPSKHNGTAILLFANSPQEELNNKSIPNGNVLFSGLTKHTLSVVRQTEIPYFHLTEAEQEGNNFGERFVNAIHHIFNKGFDRVITVGNDTPQLRPADILKADRELDRNNCILGPSKDGGFYLLGLHKRHFNAPRFLALPWQTSSLLRSITALFQGLNIRVVKQRVLLDLDNMVDLNSIMASCTIWSYKLRKLLLSFLTTVQATLSLAVVFFNRYFQHYYFNKGSPINTTCLS
ncbi:DUF2064 domain-containing protein [Arenibacter aquaticus]|uniref:DUF2064 domain-containing protein n=1 Tax=Arenibacter aquaticus TaxID=2489054 RepID=A0A3S0BYZ6_9FLAO|nr:DUF2064 domain-containing protein [Arenibacter aquaticus]RTE54851.1 DUF2064 domain-containing protein [Arenibacter aquaticus]